MFDLWTPLGCPPPVPEYRFHETRKWRFDFAWPDKKVAVEIEGGIWIRGRHSRGAGMLGDMDKYNSAGALGWRIFRFTSKQYKDGDVHLFMLDVFGLPRR